MFAENYIQRNSLPAEIQSPPDPGLGISIIIPCYREPDLLSTLNSIADCRLPECGVEVIVLVNHSEAEDQTIKDGNFHDFNVLNAWINNRQEEKIRFFAVGPVEFKKKWAGVGLARKKGMDEAIIRFNRINNSEGILVSLDADTTVEPNYLVEIEKYFRLNPAHAGATIAFRHQLEGLTGIHLQGILLYEQYMGYYKKAMGYTGYPYPMFTVGSAFATRAGAYVKRGGMNRRKAGEDFYFLQNLVHVGTVGEITETVVHPSARLSNRVPFGTGPLLKKWMAGEEDLRQTYNFEAFSDLKCFFDKVAGLFNIDSDKYEELLTSLPVPVSAFLKEVAFWNDLHALNRNCASLSTFRIRFFHKFNAFKILKFLNFSHNRYYKKADLEAQVVLLTNKLANQPQVFKQ